MTRLHTSTYLSPLLFLATASKALAFVLLLIPISMIASAHAQTYSVLYTFTGPDGASPTAGLALDAQGNLYGTTFYGGNTSCDAPYGCGTVFKLDTTGKETVLHSFTQTPDGAYPDAGLVLDAEGNLYGTTIAGGAYSGIYGNGGGTVFEIASAGVETVLYSFCLKANCTDGDSPSGLVRDAQGNLYGTTESGGGHLRSCENLSCGTIFKVYKKGKKFVEDRLYSFTGKADSGNPKAGLVLDSQGNLYGTTTYDWGHDEWGTVFKESVVGGKWKETVLYHFTGGVGTAPYAGLVLDAQGNLYGTTAGGGTYDQGTVFKLDTTGKETALYSFTGTAGDGASPQAGLVRDAQGNLYGTTVSGGDASCDAPYGCGTVFKIDASGNETVLYRFTGTGGDGEFPYAGLVQDGQGNLYGTTFNGGSASCSNGYGGVGCGIVFKLTP